MLDNGHTDKQTDRQLRQTDTDPTTVTLAAHARRGLITVAVYNTAQVCTLIFRTMLSIPGRHDIIVIYINYKSLHKIV